ncbi:MAG TPA: hypothetical protein VLB44_00765 [Kofleriaceae bacterium]|nr:hypothetical protein [Kofleriaceae bacterium]
MQLKVYDCPECGAPLPPSGLDTEVTCTACGKQAQLESGSDAVLREQKSRAEAEALFAKLGKPPRWSQRVAARLVDWRLWVLGFPFLLGILSWISDVPRGWVEAAWEHHFHERLLHVVSPVTGWLIDAGFIVAISIALLVWSLLGERVDARRDLQAMLAAKPPQTDGGPAQCRKCNAPLEVAAGMLGTRCPYCGADNLLVLPAQWIGRARKTDVELRLTMKLARERARAGRRRLLRAAAWRVPLVCLAMWYLTAPAWRSRDQASWSDMRSGDIVVYIVPLRTGGHELRAVATCAKRGRMKDPPLDTLSSHDCDDLGCESFAMFPLRKGETLHLLRTSLGTVGVRIALGERFFLGGAGIWEDFGEEISHQNLPDTEIVQPIEISGWYQVRIFSHSREPIGVQPCVDQGQ